MTTAAPPFETETDYEIETRDWHAVPGPKPLDLEDVLGETPRRILRPRWLLPCTCQSDDCPALPDAVALVQDTPAVFDKHAAANHLAEIVERRRTTGWAEHATDADVAMADILLDLLGTGGAVDVGQVDETPIQLAVGALQAQGWRLVSRPDPFKAPASSVVAAVRARSRPPFATDAR